MWSLQPTKYMYTVLTLSYIAMHDYCIYQPSDHICVFKRLCFVEQFARQLTCVMDVNILL